MKNGYINKKSIPYIVLSLVLLTLFSIFSISYSKALCETQTRNLNLGDPDHLYWIKIVSYAFLFFLISNIINTIILPFIIWKSFKIPKLLSSKDKKVLLISTVFGILLWIFSVFVVILAILLVTGGPWTIL
jgi:phosphatidylglycerophosphatase A